MIVDCFSIINQPSTIDNPYQPVDVQKPQELAVNCNGWLGYQLMFWDKLAIS